MKKIILALTLLSLLVLPFCTSSKNAAGGHKKKHIIPLTWQKDISPIMEIHCAPCHYPDKGGQKKPLNTFEATRDNLDAVLYRVQLSASDPKFMPFKSKKEPLSDSLIQVIKLWRDQGMLN